MEEHLQEDFWIGSGLGSGRTSEGCMAGVERICMTFSECRSCAEGKEQQSFPAANSPHAFSILLPSFLV